MTKLTAGQWNVLAHCATYGTTSSEDFAPNPRANGGRYSQDQLKKVRSYYRRAEALEDAGLVEEYLDDINILDAGIDALKAAGYVKSSCGCWLHPNKKVPGWAL
jgi:hypothetical protein